MINEELLKIDDAIREKYGKYKELFAKVSILTNEIKDLEQERASIIEEDGRRLVFKRPVIDLKGFNNWVKTTKWCNVRYENFEELKKSHIVDEAMIVAVYCFQPNYIAPVEFIMVLEGYLSKEEYDNKRANNPGLRDYYVKEGDSNGRTKI